MLYISCNLKEDQKGKMKFGNFLGDAFFLKSKIREYVKYKGLKLNSDVMDGPVLNEAIMKILDKAIENAKSANRDTVEEKDLVYSLINANTFKKEPTLQGLIVIGMWESLYRNMDFSPYNSLSYWLVEVGDSLVSDGNYCSLSRNNTRFHLIKSGWYRVKIAMRLEDVMNQQIFLRIYKNNIPYLMHSMHSESVSAEFKTFFYISSNGTNYYDLICWNSIKKKELSKSKFIGFSINSDQTWNQLTIEYFGESL
ncbi:MAG: hypothetical protein ACFE8V_16090 [Promethearchaeota archaeon]